MPRIELRYYGDELDEIFADGAFVHLEDMGEEWFLSISCSDGREVSFYLPSRAIKGKNKKYGRALPVDPPQGDVTVVRR